MTNKSFPRVRSVTGGTFLMPRHEFVEWVKQQGRDIHDPDINDWDICGDTLVHTAAKQGRIDVMEWCLAIGGNVNADDNLNAYRPLNCAAENGHLAAMKWLVEHGADIHWINKYGTTLMMDVAVGGSVEALNWLVSMGKEGDVSTGSSDGHTPMHDAAKHGRLAAVKWLKDHGADINAREDNGTPLQLLTVQIKIFQRGLRKAIKENSSNAWNKSTQLERMKATLQWMKKNGAV